MIPQHTSTELDTGCLAELDFEFYTTLLIFFKKFLQDYTDLTENSVSSLDSVVELNNFQVFVKLDWLQDFLKDAADLKFYNFLQDST